MEKYEVTLHYHTTYRTVVEAKDKDEALEMARSKVYYRDYHLLNNLQEDSPDVELLEGNDDE